MTLHYNIHLADAPVPPPHEAPLGVEEGVEELEQLETPVSRRLELDVISWGLHRTFIWTETPSRFKSVRKKPKE